MNLFIPPKQKFAFKNLWDSLKLDSTYDPTTVEKY